MCVIVEVVMSARSLRISAYVFKIDKQGMLYSLSSQPQCSRASRELYETRDEVRKLVRDERGHQ